MYLDRDTVSADNQKPFYPTSPNQKPTKRENPFSGVFPEAAKADNQKPFYPTSPNQKPTKRENPFSGVFPEAAKADNQKPFYPTSPNQKPTNTNTENTKKKANKRQTKVQITTKRQQKAVYCEMIKDRETLQITLGIAGSRTQKDPETLKAALAELEQELDKATIGWKLTTITHGGAKGADTLASNHARKHGLEERTRRPDYAKHGRAATHIRNEEIAANCHYLILLYADGQKTNGTKSTERAAKRHNTPTLTSHNGKLTWARRHGKTGHEQLTLW